jgi:hypothetical protein
MVAMGGGKLQNHYARSTEEESQPHAWEAVRIG